MSLRDQLSLTSESFLLFNDYIFLVSFLVALIKYYDKRNLRDKGFVLAHKFQGQYVTTGRSRWWELEAGHSASIVRIGVQMHACCSVSSCHLHPSGTSYFH